MTHGFDLARQITEPIINTLVGVTGALPTDDAQPLDGEIRPGAGATGTATIHLVLPDISSGTAWLDAFIPDGVILDLVL
jgi:hypothetical protein